MLNVRQFIVLSDVYDILSGKNLFYAVLSQLFKSVSGTAELCISFITEI